MYPTASRAYGNDGKRDLPAISCCFAGFKPCSIKVGLPFVSFRSISIPNPKRSLAQPHGNLQAESQGSTKPLLERY